MNRNKFLLFALLFNTSVFAVYPRAGYRAEFSTLFHSVSGTVTIVDQQTLVIENFNYDGTAPAVYFYLGTDDSQSAFLAGIPIGPQLASSAYVDETLVVQLTDLQTLDGYNAISVWCAAFNINFGSGTFIDPDPAVSWIFDNNGTASYTLDSYTPSEIPFGMAGQENPTLLLHLGERYEVTIINHTVHPFEVLAKRPTSTDDVVLLSMRSGVTGSLESDSTIGWEDSGTNTVAFTLSQSLYDAMIVPGKQPGYRCGIHVGSMRGNFDVCLSLPESDLNGDCLTDLFDLDIFAAGWLDNNLAP